MKIEKTDKAGKVIKLQGTVGTQTIERKRVKKKTKENTEEYKKKRG